MSFRALCFSVAFAPILAASCGGESFSNANGGGDGGIDASSGDSSTNEGGTICVPKSCPDQHWVCGTGADGCGGKIDCGQCHTANFGCTDHACVCQAKTCASLGFDCGDAPDGCGQTLHCGGTCPPNETCGGGGDHRCGTGVCVAKTCTVLGVDCGTVSDGCGAQLDCGTCLAPKTCGGSGTPNHCGCTPKTCAQLGYQCGTGDDGCGNPIDCGVCGGGGVCTNHQCTSCVPTITCAGKHYTCGSIKNDCNNVEQCGSPPTLIGSSTQCPDATHPVLYTCCSSVALSGNGPHSPDPPGPGIDASVQCSDGPTPPEPGWNCVPEASDATGVTSWCCAQ